MPSTLQPAITDGDVLVRLPAADETWATTLPPLPRGVVVTVTLGHPRLVPNSTQDPLGAGYRVVGVATEHRPIGPVVDLFVSAGLRDAHPEWWTALLARAERVFDLRLGPVQRVLATELALHTRSISA